jgi:hypothetical protein
MMQGGVDRTGFADMAEGLGNPGMDIIAAKRAEAAQAEAMDEYERRQAESDAEFRSEIDRLIEGMQPQEKSDFSFGGVFNEYITNPILSGIDQINDAGKLTGSKISEGFDNVMDFMKFNPSTAVQAQIADAMMPYYEQEFDDLVGQGADPMGTALYLSKSGTIPGLDLEMGMADGGRVGMQMGGQPYNPFVSTMPVYNAPPGTVDPYFVYDTLRPEDFYRAPAIDNTKGIPGAGVMPFPSPPIVGPFPSPIIGEEKPTTGLSPRELRGGNSGFENLQRLLGNRPGVSTEFVGDRGFRINEDGEVSMLDPESLDYKLNNLARGLLSVTPSRLLGKFFQRKPTTTQRATVNPNNAVYDRIAKTYGEETAQDFMQLNAKAINKELQSDEYKKMMSDLQAKATTPSRALTDAQAKDVRDLANRGGRKTSSGLDRAREKSKDKAAKATGKSRGHFGGR